MKVHDLIKRRIEASEPQDTILNYLRTINGKRINKTHIERLRELVGDNELCLSHRFGMTSIQWGGYGRTSGTQGGDILLAHSEKNVVVDVDKILENNRAHFDAKDERNEKRQQALDDESKCANLDHLIAQYLEAKRIMEEALADEAFGPDRHTIEKHLIEGQPQ